MFSAGVRNPRRNMLICLGVTLLACISIAWGVFEMQAAGHETLGSGLKIGLAILPAILGLAMAWNFSRGIKVFAAIRRGEKQIARWTVTAVELSEFAAIDKARNARGIEHLNDWSPQRAPPSGIEVIFVPDGVLVGDTYFALITTGLFRFTGVRLLSGTLPAIAFQTLTTYANRFSTRTTPGELRIPVSPRAGAEAAKVVAHFEQVKTGAVIANPDFYPSRIRFGLIAAPICFAIAALGFVLAPNDLNNGSVSLPSLMVIIGLAAGVAALILALAAWLLGRAQLRKH